MVYVGDIQRNTAEFHGYSMTDAGDMKRMLQAIPVNPADAAFLDIGCGKGMCMKCAAESGYPEGCRARPRPPPARHRAREHAPAEDRRRADLRNTPWILRAMPITTCSISTTRSAGRFSSR